MVRKEIILLVYIRTEKGVLVLTVMSRMQKSYWLVERPPRAVGFYSMNVTVITDSDDVWYVGMCRTGYVPILTNAEIVFSAGSCVAGHPCKVSFLFATPMLKL